MSIRPLPPAKQIESFCESHAAPRALINIGARLPEKQLSQASYVAIVEEVDRAGYTPILSFGPSEETLAQAVASASCGLLAPPTALLELASLMQACQLVVSCDTGPMHIAVAVGTPTCGIFVSTPPERFGYGEPPHLCIDARRGFEQNQSGQLKEWLQNQPRP